MDDYRAERWTLHGGRIEWNGDLPVVHPARFDGRTPAPGESVEVVRADAYQGAVDTLREIERSCRIAGGEHSSVPFVVAITRRVRAALSDAGGR